jgi:hypothetical protein
MKKLAPLYPILLSLILAAAVSAQMTTGSMNGTILDVQGAAVANADVTVTDPETGSTRTTTSGNLGSYTIRELPPGTYNVRVKASGFSTLEQKKVTLLVGQTLTLNYTLKPGAVSTILEVTSQAPLIETTSSQIGGSVSPTEVSSLPLSDRNFAGLETLVPGVRQAEGFDPTKTRVGNVSINGGDGRQIDSNVDGGDNKDLVVGGMVQNFTTEGIQEFGVLTNHYTAEAGHSVAGIVNVVTKSGTNTLHGSAFGLAQLSTLNRTNYFESLRPAQGGTCENSDVGRCKQKFHRWYYGGSFGGPVVKDKFFFFGAFEQKREPGALAPGQGVFNELTTFAQQTSGFAGGPYAFPVNSLPFPYLDTLATVKLDYKLSNLQNLALRYGRQKWTNPNDQVGNLNSPFRADGTQSNLDLNNFHDLTLGYNYAISPTKVNSLTLHVQDMVNLIGASPTHTFTYPVAGGSTWTNPNINFSDGSQVGQNVNVPQQTLIRKYQIRDDFNWTLGKHNLKFGTNWIYFAKMGGYFYFGASGYQLFFWDDPVCIAANNCPNGGANYANGISTPGALSEMAFSSGSGSTAQPPWHSLGLYGQDDYKITRRLTLNLGMRWDANIGFLRPMLGNSLNNSNRTIWWLKQSLIAMGAGMASDPGMQQISNLVSNTSALNRTTADWKEFQPRMGFAWDVLGTGRHVIRGGYGIARDQIFQNMTLFSVQQTQPTIYQTIFDEFTGGPPAGGEPPACYNGTGTFDLSAFCFGVSPLPSPGASVTDIAFGEVGRIASPRITDPWSQHASIGWAYQINPDYAFSVDYYHTLGTHEERVVNVNPQIRSVCDTRYGGDPSNPQCLGSSSARLMDLAFRNAGIALGDPSLDAGRFAQIYDYSTNNRSLYDGVNFQLKKRMNKRFMFQASYVLSWSRSWGGFPVASYGGSGLAITPQQQFAANEFNRTNFDERSRVVFSGVFDLPGGFQVAPVFQAASGRPYSMLAGGIDVDGDARPFVDRVCVGSTVSNPLYPGDENHTPFGCTMIKPNTLTGKPYIQMDLRASKYIKFGERSKLAVFAEFYNLFNRANFCNSYEENASLGPGQFNMPRAFCSGPSNAAFGGVSGYSAAAIPSLHTELGLRFEF